MRFHALLILQATMATAAIHRRSDGVRILHDPFAPGMAAKYGSPGSTDSEGFDPYADSVGAGIYSGTVKRDADGSVVIGQQYQNHNPRPGPVYSGGGYTPVSKAIASFKRESDGVSGNTMLEKLLDRHPDLVNDVSTGGALPLHTCGMSATNQHATSALISRGGDIEALDTYGFTPLHRMASNNLAIGARALLEAGADPRGLADIGLHNTPTPLEIARDSQATAVLRVLSEYGESHRAVKASQVSSIIVYSAGFEPVVGSYVERDGEASIPAAFAKVCGGSGWDAGDTWQELNAGARWFAHETNESFIYFNRADKMWWIDGPDGLGVYKARGPPWAPPAGVTKWQCLRNDGVSVSCVGPTIGVFR